MNNELQTTNHNNNGNYSSLSLTIITKNPLLYYPELRDVDIINSTILHKEEKQVILASLNYPKIRTINIIRGDDDTNNTPEYDELVKIIAKAIWDMGITEKSMTKDEQLAFIPVAIEEIKEFDNLTIEDIRICFKKGSRRKYGDFFQMSITTVNCWLTAYTEETKPTAMQRLPQLKKIEDRTVLQIIQDENIIITNEQVQKRHNDWLLFVYNSFEEFKISGNYNFYDYNSKFFHYCKKLKLISLNEKQQADIWDRAVKQLKDEYHPKNAKNFGQRIDLKDMYDRLKHPDEVDKKGEDLIVARAKKITVMYFFMKLIKNKKELKQVIDDSEKKLNSNGTKTVTDKKD